MSNLHLYDVTIVPAQRSLTALHDILVKVKAHSKAESLPSSRIIEDMLPFTFQVYQSSDLAYKLSARLTQTEPWKRSKDDVKTWDDMFDTLKAAQEAVNGVDKEKVNSMAGKTVTFGMGPGKELSLPAEAYATAFILPNIFFHVTTAYNIARKEGVEVGKMDYLQPHLAAYMS